MYLINLITKFKNLIIWVFIIALLASVPPFMNRANDPVDIYLQEDKQDNKKELDSLLNFEYELYEKVKAESDKNWAFLENYIDTIVEAY